MDQYCFSAHPTRLKENLDRTNVVFIFLIDFNFTRLNSVESIEFLINSTISAKSCAHEAILSKSFAFYAVERTAPEVLPFTCMCGGHGNLEIC